MGSPYTSGGTTPADTDDHEAISSAPTHPHPSMSPPLRPPDRTIIIDSIILFL
jgi:hypothetical protein